MEGGNMNLIRLEEEKEEPKKDPRTAHYESCEKAYWEYVKTHPEEFKKGEYVSVIYGDPKARGYKSYQEMARRTREIGGGKPWWFTNFGQEETQVKIYAVGEVEVEGRRVGEFEGTGAGLVAYIEGCKIESVPGLPGILSPDPGVPVEKRVKMMVDTGASVVALPKSVTSGMNAEFLRSGNAGTGNGNARVNYIGMKIKVSDGEYMEVETVEMGNLKDCLLGQSFLKHCKHTWIGNKKMELRLLRPGETEDEEEQGEIQGPAPMEIEVVKIKTELEEKEKEIKKWKERYQKMTERYERARARAASGSLN
jgi:hypothetical protein